MEISLPQLNEDFWEDLLTLMESRKVIPVIGEGVVTTAAGEQLYTSMARRLAERLGMSSLPAPSALNDVACAWMMNGGERNRLYTRLHRALRDENPQPGETLLKLAGIPAFQLFLTTTFDPLLAQAINQVRFAGAPITQVAAFSPGAEAQDLPTRMRNLQTPAVYHLMGRATATPDYVLWEEDALEFVVALHQHLPVLEKLARDLREHSLLLIGLGFSDWLTRFFLRVAKQERLSELGVRTQYLTTAPGAGLPSSMVVFFGGLTKSIQLAVCDPVDFVKELAKRWEEQFGAAEALPPAGAGVPASAASAMPVGAIFLSYAREDELAARRLKQGLEEEGCVVWYDRERLIPGVRWDNHLEDEVKQHCSLILSVISRTTETTPSAYYHQERNWAAERFGLFSQGARCEEYYIPVVIDDSPLPAVREPRVFAQIQAAILPGGEVTKEFATRLRLLQEKRKASL